MADKSFQQLCIEADADFYHDSLRPISYIFGGRRVFRQHVQMYEKPAPMIEDGTVMQSDGGMTASGVLLKFGDVEGIKNND